MGLGRVLEMEGGRKGAAPMNATLRYELLTVSIVIFTLYRLGFMTGNWSGEGFAALFMVLFLLALFAPLGPGGKQKQ